MDENKSLALQQSTGMVSLADWQIIMSQAPVIATARMFGFQNPEQAAVVLAAARELGLPPVTSLNGLVYVIDTQKGRRAGLSTAGMAALVLKSGIIAKIKITNHTDQSGEPTGCTVYMERRDGTMAGEESFMQRDAERADLFGKDNWKKYPGDMYYSRAYARTARRYCSDACAGMYTADELGAVTDQDGVPIESSKVIKSDFPISKPPTVAQQQEEKDNAPDIAGLIAMFPIDRVLGANGGVLPGTQAQVEAITAKLAEEDRIAAIENQTGDA